jgi:hypothetical protein
VRPHPPELLVPGVDDVRNFRVIYNFILQPLASISFSTARRSSSKMHIQGIAYRLAKRGNQLRVQAASRT